MKPHEQPEFLIRLAPLHGFGWQTPAHARLRGLLNVALAQPTQRTRSKRQQHQRTRNHRSGFRNRGGYLSHRNIVQEERAIVTNQRAREIEGSARLTRYGLEAKLLSSK